MGDSQPAAQWKPKATLKPEGSRLLLLISSMSGSLEVKTRQSRVRGILDASFLPREQVEILDGSDPAVKQRRLQLFILSGKRAQYPQLFLVTPSSEAQDKESETTKYLGNAEDIFYLHDTDTLGDAIGLCLLDTPPPPAEKDLGNTTDVTAADEDDGPVMDTSLTTAWVRTKSTRNIFSASEKQSEKEVTETKKSPEAVPAEVDAKSEPDKHDEYTEEQKGAASKIQLAFRVCLLPIVKLKKQLQDIRADTKKKVEKSQKDCSKKITKIQKQFEKDCKKVDQLAKDIRRHQKKEKQLKKDIKGATKTRDNLRKKNEKERDKAKKCDKYLRRLDQDRKHLATWDRDIADVQAENEQLLGLIAKISEEISMRGVNWIELTKEVEVSPEKSNGDKPWWERAAEKKAPVKPTASATKISSAPLRVPHRRKLKGVLEKQESRQNMLSMVRQGSQRILQQKDPKDIEVAPIYFARVNSRARLFG